MKTIFEAPSINNVSVSLTEITLEWLLVTAAFSCVFSLFLAWVATLIIYGRVAFLKRLFPVPHNLIRSHIDYLMMTSLLGVFYFMCWSLQLDIPKIIIAVLCFGVLYNPFGFIIKAINPKAGQSDTLLGKIMVCVGFLPATIGFGYISIAVLYAMFN